MKHRINLFNKVKLKRWFRSRRIRRPPITCTCCGRIRYQISQENKRNKFCSTKCFNLYLSKQSSERVSKVKLKRCLICNEILPIDEIIKRHQYKQYAKKRYCNVCAKKASSETMSKYEGLMGKKLRLLEKYDTEEYENLLYAYY